MLYIGKHRIHQIYKNPRKILYYLLTIFINYLDYQTNQLLWNLNRH